MRFVRYDDDQLGLLTDDGTGVIDVGNRLGIDAHEPLVAYIEGDHDASAHADADPDHGVELPFADRRTDHEVELAFVMGAEARDVPAAEAWDHIFGYTVLLDISLRGDQDRSNRKSYDTFTVVGPCVATPDEVGDPQDLEMHLDLNGERRQAENTRDMVYTCADVVQYASLGTTLEVGDVVTTGTPEGVSELSEGDRIEAGIEGIGSMTVDVTERDVSYAEADVSKGGQE